jgi:hypothetical protein
MRLNLSDAVEPATSYAGWLFFYLYGFILPPREKTTVEMRCRLPMDMKLTAASSHMHSRGVAQRADLLEPDGSKAKDLFDTRDWDEPETAISSPETRLGTAGVRCASARGPSRLRVRAFAPRASQSATPAWRRSARRSTPRV